MLAAIYLAFIWYLLMILPIIFHPLVFYQKPDEGRYMQLGIIINSGGNHDAFKGSLPINKI